LSFNNLTEFDENCLLLAVGSQLDYDLEYQVVK